jgi:hypothetical protein
MFISAAINELTGLCTTGSFPVNRGWTIGGEMQNSFRVSHLDDAFADLITTAA